MTIDRTMFNIPEANLPRLKKAVAKLSAKALKFGGWEFDILVVGDYFRENPNGTQTRIFEVCLDVEPIRIGDWTFVARLDHSQETGNIIRAVPNSGVMIDERFRYCAPNCEHCNHKRKRRDTFILHNNETGELKQVGSTCLDDFLGHDPRNLGRMAELLGYADEYVRSMERGSSEMEDRRYINLQHYLIHCAAMVRTKGWVSGKVAYETGVDSTRVLAMEHMLAEQEITEADYDIASKALEWAQSFEHKAELNDYEHNVLTIANSVVIENRACGIAASIVGVYRTKVAPAPKAQAVDLDNMEQLIGLFNRAGSKLKNPKLLIDLGNVGVVELTMAKAHHKVPGSINVKSGGGFDAPWYGRILANGRYQPSRIAPAGIDQELIKLSVDPAGMAAAHGKHTGNCCMCNKALTDQRSLAVGYGKTCATNWGLPY